MGGCNVVAILSMANMACLELVSQDRPFPCSTDHFQYMQHTEGRSLMFGFKFHFEAFEFMTILSSFFHVLILKAIVAVEWKGSGLRD